MDPMKGLNFLGGEVSDIKAENMKFSENHEYIAIDRGYSVTIELCKKNYCCCPSKEIIQGTLGRWIYA